MLNMRLESTRAELNLKRMEENMPNAVARALNRSITSARVFMRRKVADDVGLLQKVVDKDYRIDPARSDKLKAVLEVRGKRIPLEKFGATGPLPTRGRPPYVRARVGGVSKTYGPQPGLATPFRAEMKSGHIGVFRRLPLPSRRFSRGAWSKNLPIVELRGPSLVRVFIKHLPEGLAYAEEVLAKNLEHEFSFAMRSLGTV